MPPYEPTSAMAKTVSIIIPLYNHGRQIKACIESIWAQTYPVSEIIVVDDGSTDGGADVVRALPGVVLIQQENKGAPAARNKGFEASHGEYVLFSDADVFLKPNMIETMAGALDNHPEAAFAYSGFRFGGKKFRGLPFSPERLRKHNYIHTNSLVRREAFVGFDPSVRRLQDWDLWLSMVEQGAIGICASVKPLFFVKVDGKSRIGSQWFPKFFYDIPWRRIGWIPGPIKKYEASKEALRQKHPQIK